MKNLTDQEIKNYIDEAINELIEKDVVGDEICVMNVRGLSVTMSREQYDDIMTDAVSIVLKNTNIDNE